MLCLVHGMAGMMHPSLMERILHGMLFGIFFKSTRRFHPQIEQDLKMNKNFEILRHFMNFYFCIWRL